MFGRGGAVSGTIRNGDGGPRRRFSDTAHGDLFATAHSGAFFQISGLAHATKDGLLLSEHGDVAPNSDFSLCRRAKIPLDVEKSILFSVETPPEAVRPCWPRTLPNLRRRAADLERERCRELEGG